LYIKILFLHGPALSWYCQTTAPRRLYKISRQVYLLVAGKERIAKNIDQLPCVSASVLNPAALVLASVLTSSVLVTTLCQTCSKVEQLSCTTLLIDKVAYRADVASCPTFVELSNKIAR